MSDDAATPDAVPTPAEQPSTPAVPLLHWPPPGLERLRGDLWAAAVRLAVGGSIFVLPMLASLALPQDPWRPGLFGDAWWVLLITSVTGIWVLMGGFIRLSRLFGRWRAAEVRGYRARTVAMVLADRAGDTGYLIQGAREYSLIPQGVRQMLVSGRLAQSALAVAAGLWLATAFIVGVLGAARDILTAAGLTLWTLAPPAVAVAAILVLRAAENTVVMKARRAWYAKPWSEDLARDEIQVWHAALAERQNSLGVPAGTAGAGGARQRVGAVATAVAGLVVLVFSVPLVSVAGIGPLLRAIAIPKFSRTSERAGRMEALEPLRPPIDESITIDQAGTAFSSLLGEQRDDRILRQPGEVRTKVIPDEEWRENPTGLRPELWARDLVPRLAEGLDPSVVAYLHDLGMHPAFESLAVLGRASALDEVGALYVLPLPDDLDMWRLPIPRYSGVRELAYAQVGVAVADAAVGRVDEAEARLRDLVGAGTLMAREGTTLISNLIGVVIAGIGGDALLNLYTATGQADEARELRERLRAAEAAMKKAALGAGDTRIEELPEVVTDTSALRGLRWEFFGMLNALGPCLNLKRAVFGPPDDFDAWLAKVRLSLVRYEGEEEILQLMLRGISVREEERGSFLSLSRLYSQVMGGGVGSCAELAAAAAVW